MLNVSHLSFSYGKKTILHNVSFAMNKGEIVFLLGPNGVGKTTLIRTLIGDLRPSSGQIFVNNTDINCLQQKQLAKEIAYIPQSHALPFPYKVSDMVMMGRFPHSGLVFNPTDIDRKIVKKALEETGIRHLKDREYMTLSGGERQLVLFARALAQQSNILIMDEPTANLDFGNQHLVFEHIKKLSIAGYVILITTHSPAQALLHADKIALLYRDGRFGFDKPSAILTTEYFKQEYGIDICSKNTSLTESILSYSC